MGSWRTGSEKLMASGKSRLLRTLCAATMNVGHSWTAPRARPAATAASATRVWRSDWREPPVSSPPTT
jgi:hypothetical protein